MTQVSAETGHSRKRAARRKLYSAPALEKGLDILELLAREPESISLKEIAQRLERSVGEIFRMLVVLEQRGYVQMADDSERYRLSIRLFQLAHWHLPINRLTGAATGPMRRLALQAGQSCHLTNLSGARVVVVARQDSFRDRSFAMRVGAESPLLNSCSGRIFFALADTPTRDTMIQCIKDLGEDTGAVRAIEDVSAALREQSCYEMPSSQVAGIVDIGTPVIDHDGTIAASLVIPFLRRIDRNNDSDLSMVKRYLVNSAKEISAALGADVS